MREKPVFIGDAVVEETELNSWHEFPLMEIQNQVWSSKQKCFYVPASDADDTILSIMTVVF